MAKTIGFNTVLGREFCSKVRELIKNDPYEVEMFECLLDFYTGKAEKDVNKGFTKTKFTPAEDDKLSPEMSEHIIKYHEGKFDLFQCVFCGEWTNVPWGKKKNMCLNCKILHRKIEDNQ